jgi:predicted lipoprotein with Yx(FWY)xxD motif
VKRLLWIIGLPLFLAACTGVYGGSGSSGSSTGLYGSGSTAPSTSPAVAATAAPPATTSAAPAAAAAVVTAQNARLGTILVNAQGRTLYYFVPERGGRLVCTSGACTTYWPPVLSSSSATPAGGAGVTGQLGVISRASGQQITYNRWPLYTFAGDSAAGQTSGQAVVAFGGEWLAATAGLQP